MRSTTDALANLVTEIRDEQADDRIYMRAELKQVSSIFLFFLIIISDPNGNPSSGIGVRADSWSAKSMRKRRGGHELENQRSLQILCKHGDRFKSNNHQFLRQTFRFEVHFLAMKQFFILP